MRFAPESEKTKTADLIAARFSSLIYLQSCGKCLLSELYEKYTVSQKI